MPSPGWSPCNSWLIRMDFHLSIVAVLLASLQRCLGRRCLVATEVCVLIARISAFIVRTGNSGKSAVRSLLFCWIIYASLRAGASLSNVPHCFSVFVLIAGAAVTFHEIIEDQRHADRTMSAVLIKMMCMAQAALLIMRTCQSSRRPIESGDARMLR